jgi:hypothetical protein
MDFRANIRHQLEPFALYIDGNPLASLMALKGRPGASELADGAPFSGDDGLALDKAFGRLGWGYGSRDTRIWLGVLLAPNGHPPLEASKLRLICEIVDPLAIVALDEKARTALIDAFSSDDATLSMGLAPSAEAWAFGRHLTSVEGFEDALADAAAKQKVWAQLKRCSPSATEA